MQQRNDGNQLQQQHRRLINNIIGTETIDHFDIDMQQIESYDDAHFAKIRINKLLKAHFLLAPSIGELFDYLKFMPEILQFLIGNGRPIDNGQT